MTIRNVYLDKTHLLHLYGFVKVGLSQFFVFLVLLLYPGVEFPVPDLYRRVIECEPNPNLRQPDHGKESEMLLSSCIHCIGPNQNEKILYDG